MASIGVAVVVHPLHAEITPYQFVLSDARVKEKLPLEVVALFHKIWQFCPVVLLVLTNFVHVPSGADMLVLLLINITAMRISSAAQAGAVMVSVVAPPPVPADAA